MIGTVGTEQNENSWTPDTIVLMESTRTHEISFNLWDWRHANGAVKSSFTLVADVQLHLS